MASQVGSVTHNQIIVQVWLSASVTELNYDNVWLPYQALIDTGATGSCISYSATRDLLNSAQNRGVSIPFTAGNISTATQVSEKVPMCDVDIALGIEGESTWKKVKRMGTTWIFHTLQVSVIPSGENYNVLLGMDFLQHCHLSVSKHCYILSN